MNILKHFVFASCLVVLSVATAWGAPPWNYTNQSPVWPPPSGYFDASYPIRALEAIAGTNPPSISLKIYDAGTYNIFRKDAGGASWGAVVANVTISTGQTWTDTTVVEGSEYEYRIVSTAPVANYAGYILAGVNVDKTLPKGHFVVVVANDIVANCAEDYAQYKADLVADGWVVDEIVTPRAVSYTSNGTGALDADGVPSAPFPNEQVNIRNQIIALYNQYPGQVKNVILLGRVIVARSGMLLYGPDGHGNRAAVGADAYYADMDGNWTDTKTNGAYVNGKVFSGWVNNADGTVTLPSGVNIAGNIQSTIQYYRNLSNTGGPYTVQFSGTDYRYTFTFTSGLVSAIVIPQDTSISVSAGTVNVVGDNKFDAEYLGQILPNANVEIGFGRVDMSSNIAGEYEATRTYFKKDHRYKTASLDFLPGRRAVNRILYDQVQNSCIISMPGVVGVNKLDFIRTTDLPAVPNGSYDQDAAWTAQNGPDLFFFKGNSTPDFSDGGKAVFWTGLQSHWGYWFEPSTSSGQNVMAKRMSENNFTLSYTWSIFGCWYIYQRMGLGYDLGDMMRYSISSKPWASGASPGISSASYLFMESMGDPALRLFMFAPPTELSVMPSGGVPTLSWTASRPPPITEPQIIGYHIYRAATAAGPFTRLTAQPVAGTTYTDNTVSAGSYTYMVRAVRQEITGAGSYYNASLGISQSVDLSNAPAALSISTSSLPDANWNTPYSTTLAGQGGVPVYSWSLVSGLLPPGLSLASNGTISGTSTAAGNYAFTVRASDKLSTTADKALSLTAQSNGVTTLFSEAGNFTTANSVATVGNPYGDPTTKVAGPVYGYESFLRFDLASVNVNNGLSRAKLQLNIGDSTPLNSYALLRVALSADAGDSWSEATLNYSNRPADNPAFASIAASAFPVRYGTMEIDITPFVRETLANDPSKKLTVRIFTTTFLSFGNYIAINSRYSPGNSRPKLLLESTNAPAITATTPAVSPATINAGSALQIVTTVTPLPARAGTTTLSWAKVSGPGTVTFTNASAASTGATFSSPGDYIVRLTANDSVLQSYKDINVRVLSNSDDIASVTGPADGLLLRLPLDEASGSTATDASGNGRSGTLLVTGTSGPPTRPVAPFTAANKPKVGNALQFIGPSQRVEITNSTGLDNINQLSISLWVKINTADANSHAIISKRATSSTSTISYALQVTSAEKISATVGTTTITGDTILQNDQWYHVVMVYDGSQTTNNLQLYLNGNADKFGSRVGAIPSNPTGKLQIGDFLATPLGGTTVGLVGMADEVRVYNRLLTLSEIQDLGSAAPGNVGPVIATTPSVSGTANQAFSLVATVTDDGNPTPPSALTLGWNALSGNGSVAFGNAAAGSTSATASLGGAYVLRLSASDGGITTFADVAANIVSGLTPYQQWLQANGLPTDGSGNGALGATPLNDGVTNAMKYALGITPNVQGYGDRLSTGKVNVSGQDYLSLTYIIAEPAPAGISYVVKTGSDLVSWTAVDTQLVVTSVNAGLRTTTVRDTHPVTSPEEKRFIRLEVNVP